MSPKRLEPSAIATQLESWPDELCDLALELRAFVLCVAPELDETVAFHSLCYVKPDMPYGVIGGGVCGIGAKDDCLQLGFIHGASLLDPAGLLTGKGKAKRHIEIRSRRDIRPAAFKKLIRAAIKYDPRAG